MRDVNNNELSAKETASMELMRACASAKHSQTLNLNNAKKAIKTGADINYQYDVNRMGIVDTRTNPKIISSPLHAAVFKDKADIVTLLCKKRRGKPPLEINKPNQLGIYALHLAVERGNVAIVHTLLEHGADPSLICSMGRDYKVGKMHVIEVAIKSKKWEAAQPIIEDIIKHEGSIADAAKQAGKMLSTLARDKRAPDEFIAFLEGLEKEAGFTAATLMKGKLPSAEMAAPKISKTPDPAALAEILGYSIATTEKMIKHMQRGRIL